MASPSNISAKKEVADKAANAVEKELQELKKDLPSIINFRPTIWKIPSDIRKGLEDAYEPKLMPIGPFHRKKENVPPMAKLKLLYVHDLLERNKNNAVNDYADGIADCEEQVRQQYSEEIHLTSEEFVKLLVIDGCFVVEYLLKRAAGRASRWMPLKANTRNMPTLKNDLLLMENQIPWFVLEIIHGKTQYDIRGNTNEDLTLLDLALFFLHKGSMKKHMLPEQYWSRGDGNMEIYHLLHLSHLCLLQGLNKEENAVISLPPETLKAHVLRQLTDSIFKVIRGLFRLLKKVRGYLSWVPIAFLYIIVSFFELLIIWKTPGWYASRAHKATVNTVGNAREKEKKPRALPTATELKDAGVYFKRKENERCYLDVSFNDGTMEIARVSIDGSSRSTFRNLLALEQICPAVDNCFTSYVVFMDNLIDTAADVALLKRVGVIESKLGSDQDVANFFNGIRSGVCFDFEKHYLANLFEELEEYCKKDHNRWRAKLMHDYFSNPWTILSVLAAVILLALTAVQTAYSIKSFSQDSSK